MNKSLLQLLMEFVLFFKEYFSFMNEQGKTTRKKFIIAIRRIIQNLQIVKMR